MNKKIEVLENDKNLNKEDFYIGFKEKLETTHSFPSYYIYKFVVPAEHSNIAKIRIVFEDKGADFSSRESKNGKYLSLTVKVLVNSADDVITNYRQVSAIKGIVML